MNLPKNDNISSVTLKTLQDHQAALAEKFGAFEGIACANVTQTQLSIARHYGGCKVGGQHFVYNPADDSLIREDVVKWLGNLLRARNAK